MSSYDLSKTGIAVFLTGVTLVEIGNPIKELVNLFEDVRGALQSIGIHSWYELDTNGSDELL